MRDQMTKAHCVVTGSADGSHKELRPRHWEEGEDADRLKQKIRSGECIAFVGSGPSTGAGYPSWNTLLRELCSATGVVCADQLECKPTETLLALADSCLQANAHEYCNVLSRYFACTPPNIPDELRYVAKLKFRAYVTTAFDPLLHLALEDEATGNLVYTYPSLPTEFNQRHLFHIHGKIEVGSEADSSKIILGSTAFAHAYDGKNSLLWGFLQQLLTYRSCCFVGCGFREPDLQRLFTVCGTIREEIGKMGGLDSAPEHFALLPRDLPELEVLLEQNEVLRQATEREIAAQNSRRAEVLKQAGITVIRYEVEKSRHLGLKEFLRECADIVPIEPGTFLQQAKP